MRYQVRPEPVEPEFVDAVQWFPEKGHPLVIAFVDEGKIRGQLRHAAGIAFIDPGDWIVTKENDGRIYPVPDRHFANAFILL